MALAILSWLLACSEDEPGIDEQATSGVWHSGAEEELIAFLRRNEENSHAYIYVMDPDGSNVRMQGTRPVSPSSRNLLWSADGESLAYWKIRKYSL